MLYLLAVIAIFAIAVASFIAFPFFLKWLAEEDILFTTVREGTAKAIMCGDSFDRFVMSFAGHHLNENWEVVRHTDKQGREGEDDYYDHRSPLLKHLGLYWVGWPWANSVYVYAFEWNEPHTDERGKEVISHRAEATDFIFVADFVYAILTDAAETKDRLSVDLLTLTTVAIRNPYCALFRGEDWILRVTAAINRHAKKFVGNKGYDDLISTDEGELCEFSRPIIELNKFLADETEDSPSPRGLGERYGVEIRTADLQTTELTGDARPQYQEAATKVYVAEQTAKATRLTGQAEADVIEMRGDKEAVALEKRLVVIAAHGEAGIELARLDAMRDSSQGPGNTIIWANNPFVPLADVLKKEGGGK